MDNRTSAYTGLTTTASSPMEYFKILVLQRLNDLVEAWEFYFKQKHLGTIANINVVHARTQTLLLILSAYGERKLEPEVYERMRKTLFNIEPNEEQLLNTYFELNKQLDKDRITRMDTKTVYDGSRTEIENEEKGL